MSGRLRRCAAGAALVVTCSFAGSTAHAYVTNDINNITLGTTFATLGGPWYLNDPIGHAQFRWLDAAGKATIISANRCDNLAERGRVNYAAGDTTYGTLFWGTPGADCFFVRGRTAPGEGAMANPHDGRVRR